MQVIARFKRGTDPEIGDRLDQDVRVLHPHPDARAAEAKQVHQRQGDRLHRPVRGLTRTALDQVASAGPPHQRKDGDREVAEHPLVRFIRLGFGDPNDPEYNPRMCRNFECEPIVGDRTLFEAALDATMRRRKNRFDSRQAIAALSPLFHEFAFVRVAREDGAVALHIGLPDGDPEDRVALAELLIRTGRTLRARTYGAEQDSGCSCTSRTVLWGGAGPAPTVVHLRW